MIELILVVVVANKQQAPQYVFTLTFSFSSLTAKTANLPFAYLKLIDFIAYYIFPRLVLPDVNNLCNVVTQRKYNMCSM